MTVVVVDGFFGSKPIDHRSEGLAIEIAFDLVLTTTTNHFTNRPMVNLMIRWVKAELWKWFRRNG